MKKITFLFLLFAFQFLHGQNFVVIDSLLSRLKKSSDTTKINIFNQLAYEYRNSQITKTDSFASLAIELATKENYYKGLGYAYIHKGFAEKMIGDYPRSIQTFRLALTNFVRCNFKPGYSAVYNNIAGVYYLQSNYVKAQFYYFESLNISEELNDEIGIAKTYNNIGAVYMEQKQLDKAIQYFQKANSILERLDPNQAADCLNNIGTVYQYKKDTVQAIENYRKSMEINKKIGDKKDVSSILNNIGFMYAEGGNYKLALDHYYESLQIDESLGDVHGMSSCYGNITNCYIKLNMLFAANKYANKMLQIAKKYSIINDISDSYKYLNMIEEANGNYKEALVYHKLYKAYNDSVFNDENKNAQSQLEGLYVKEKSEKEKLILTKDEEIKKIKSKEREKEFSQYILLIGFVLFLFILIIYIAFFLVRRNRYS